MNRLTGERRAAVLISGVGVISAAGVTVDETLECFAGARQNTCSVSVFETPLDQPVFEVHHIPKDRVGEQMRTLRLATHATRAALTDAGLDSIPPASRVGVCLGTSVACQLNDIDFYGAYRETRSAPMGSVDRYLKGNVAQAIAADIGATGPSLTVANACSSGTDAIGVAFSWLKAGICDMAIAGGADELSRIPLCGFNALSILSAEPCKPFDRDRNGLNLGEGAGILLLETAEHARARGFTTSTQLTGYGLASDAYHLTAPRPDGSGLKAAINKALAQAGIRPGDIAFVNAHGTATPDNDRVEGGVLADVFGKDLKFLSTKGYTGHTLGAAGGLEAAFTVISLRHGWIPASAGFTRRDEEIPISPVDSQTTIEGEYGLSTSLAFGGNNSALVMRRSTELATGGQS